MMGPLHVSGGVNQQAPDVHAAAPPKRVRPLSGALANAASGVGSGEAAGKAAAGLGRAPDCSDALASWSQKANASRGKRAAYRDDDDARSQGDSDDDQSEELHVPPPPSSAVAPSATGSSTVSFAARRRLR